MRRFPTRKRSIHPSGSVGVICPGVQISADALFQRAEVGGRGGLWNSGQHGNQRARGTLPLALGKDLTGRPYVADLARDIAEERGVTLDEGLSARQRGLANAVTRMLEDHFYWALVWDRWMVPAHWAKTRVVYFGRLPPPLRWLVPGNAAGDPAHGHSSFVIGLAVMRPAQLRMGALAPRMAEAPEEERARLGGEMARLRTRSGRASRVIAGLLIVAVVTMAVARYV